MSDETPMLRRDLVFTRRDDLDVTLISDPELGHYHRIGQLEAEIFTRFDGKQTFRDVSNYLRDTHQVDVSVDDLIRFADRGRQLRLIDVASDPQYDGEIGKRAAKTLLRLRADENRTFRHGQQGPLAELLDQGIAHATAGRMFSAARAVDAALGLAPQLAFARELRRDIFKSSFQFHNKETSWFFYPIPLIRNPDQFLGVLARLLGWAFRPATAVVATLGILCSALYWANNWQDVAVTSKNLLSTPSTALLVGLLIMASGWLETFGHECMHGATCVKFGGKVTHMGLLWVGVSMGAYCEVSSTYLFQTKWHRVAVPLAGPIWNAIMATSWTLLSFVLPDGTFIAKFALLKGAWDTTTTVISVLPFYKDDFYYALSERFDVLNAMEKTMGTFQSLACRHLLGIELAAPKLQPHERWFVMRYGVINLTVTSFFLIKTVTVVTLYALEQLTAFSFIALAIMLVTVVGRRVQSLLKFLWERRGALAKSRRFALVSLLLVGGVVAAALLPMERERVATCFVGREQTPIESHSDGVVTEVLVAVGEHVTKGQPLVRLTSERLTAELRECTTTKEIAAVELQALEGPVRQEEVDAKQAIVASARLSLQQARLTRQRVSQALSQGVAVSSALEAAQQQEEKAASELAQRQAELAERLSRATPERRAQAQAALSVLTARCDALAHRVTELERVAPTDGQVLSVFQGSPERLLGAQVREGTPLLILAAADTSRAQFEVPAYELSEGGISISQVKVRLASHPTQTLVGEVSSQRSRTQGRNAQLTATLAGVAAPADAACSVLIDFGREPFYRTLLRPFRVLLDLGFWTVW